MRYFTSFIPIVERSRAKFTSEQKGTTLIDLVVATTIFSIFIALVYPALLFVTDQVTILNDRMMLNDRGKRIIDFMHDDLKMIGFIIGPTARIPYCTGGATPVNQNVIAHVDGASYDSLTFLTSLPVELDMTTSCINSQTDSIGNPRIDYLLTTRNNSITGATSITVDAAASCTDLVAVSGNNNGRSLITFETIAPSIAAIVGGPTQFYYTVNAVATNLTLNEALVQDIPDNSTVFTVRQYRYDVDTTGRDLRRLGWNSSCTTADLADNNPPEYPSDILDGSDGSDGGIDGLQFEFLSVDTVSGLISTASTPPADIRTLKAIKIWLLLRAEFPDKNYTNDNTYTLGCCVTLGPFSDNYRRLLLSKTVEVKNVGF
ncbi:MAG: PilW family protein [Thermodesulfobacteriota bacterium]